MVLKKGIIRCSSFSNRHGLNQTGTMPKCFSCNSFSIMRIRLVLPLPPFPKYPEGKRGGEILLGNHINNGFLILIVSKEIFGSKSIIFNPCFDERTLSQVLTSYFLSPGPSPRLPAQGTGFYIWLISLANVFFF